MVTLNLRHRARRDFDLCANLCLGLRGNLSAMVLRPPSPNGRRQAAGDLQNLCLSFGAHMQCLLDPPMAVFFFLSIPQTCFLLRNEYPMGGWLGLVGPDLARWPAD